MSLFGPPNIEKLKVKRDIKGLTRALDYRKDFQIQQAAAEALGQIRDARAVEPLLAATSDLYVGVRQAAERALVQLGEAAVEPLVCALVGKNTKARTVAAQTLREIDLHWENLEAAARAFPVLIAALRDADVSVRQAAAQTLGLIGGERAVEPLLVALRDYNINVRRLAVQALGDIGDSRAVEPLVLTLGDLDASVRLYTVRALGKLGDTRAQEPLVAALGDKNEDIRIEVARTLLAMEWQSMALEPIHAILGEALKHRDMFVSHRAAEALGKLGDTRAVESLLGALWSNDVILRRHAADALGQIGDARAVEPLLTTLKDPLMWGNTAKALKQLKDTQVLDRLVSIVQDYSDIRMQIGAVLALGEMGNARAVEPLVVVLRQADDLYVQSSVMQALGQIGDTKAIEVLVALLRNQGETWPVGVRVAAAETLGRYRIVQAVEPLLHAIQDEDWKVRQDATEALGLIGDARAVEPLLVALREGNVVLRSYAARALGLIGDARAVEPLLVALQDGTKSVRDLAARALGLIGDVRAVEPLITAFAKKGIDYFTPQENQAIEALGQIGDVRAVEPLITVLTDGNFPYVKRIQAIKALGQIGDVRAVNSLLRCTRDRQTAEEAAHALRKILERNASATAREDLHAITRLDRVMQLKEGTGTDRCGNPNFYEARVDCSYIRQLARQELIRRGFEA